MVRAGIGRVVSDDEALDDELEADAPDGQDGPFQQT
jgi:hypothetical protein